MVGEAEHLAAVSPLPLEHRRGVMEGVGEDVDVRLAPRHQAPSSQMKPSRSSKSFLSATGIRFLSIKPAR
jgi:hypothetical protein